MGSQKSDLLLHPIRLRIVMAVAADEATTADIQQRLPDVPVATLYRHVATLADAGILEVVSERRNRGGVERTYRLVEGAAYVGPEDATSMNNDEHLRGFVTFVGTLIDSMARYLDDPQSQPGIDPMGYRQLPLWLSDDELEAMVGELGAVLERYASNDEAPERKRLTFSNVLIPDVSAAGEPAAS